MNFHVFPAAKKHSRHFWGWDVWFALSLGTRSWVLMPAAWWLPRTRLSSRGLGRPLLGSAWGFPRKVEADGATWGPKQPFNFTFALKPHSPPQHPTPGLPGELPEQARLSPPLWAHLLLLKPRGCCSALCFVPSPYSLSGALCIGRLSPFLEKQGDGWNLEKS